MFERFSQIPTPLLSTCRNVQSKIDHQFEMCWLVVVHDAARGEFVSGADHMGANEAVPTIWDPHYMVAPPVSLVSVLTLHS